MKPLARVALAILAGLSSALHAAPPGTDDTERFLATISPLSQRDRSQMLESMFSQAPVPVAGHYPLPLKWVATDSEAAEKGIASARHVGPSNAGFTTFYPAAGCVDYVEVAKRLGLGPLPGEAPPIALHHGPSSDGTAWYLRATAKTAEVEIAALATNLTMPCLASLTIGVAVTGPRKP